MLKKNFTRFTAFTAELGIVNPDSAMSEADRIASQLLPTIELYPDAIDVLEYIRGKNFFTALITSSEKRHIRNALAKYSLNEYFSEIITGDDVSNRKPHPEPLLLALARLSMPRESAIVIGDSSSDLEAARNAEIDSVLFYPPEHEKFYKLTELLKYEPTYIVHDFRDIINIL